MRESCYYNRFGTASDVVFNVIHIFSTKKRTSGNHLNIQSGICLRILACNSGHGARIARVGLRLIHKWFLRLSVQIRSLYYSGEPMVSSLSGVRHSKVA